MQPSQTSFYNIQGCNEVGKLAFNINSQTRKRSQLTKFTAKRESQEGAKQGLLCKFPTILHEVNWPRVGVVVG